MSDLDRFAEWFQGTWPEAGDRLPALLAFAAALREASGRVALVSHADRGRILSRHLPESLAPAFVNRVPAGSALLDVGSGGGLPAIPLGILRPDLDLTLVEPRAKKVRFLDRMLLEHGLHGRVVEGRLEDVPGPETPWGLVVSRALRWTPEMLRNLESLTREDAVLLRFGPHPAPAGIEGESLGEGHGIQVWPRPRWQELPDTP